MSIKSGDQKKDLASNQVFFFDYLASFSATHFLISAKI